MKQFRGCSRLVYAQITVAEGKTTYGTPKQVAPVKTISRDIASDNEKVFADNTVQEQHYTATTVTRTFSCTRLAPDVEADLLGSTKVEVASSKLAYATPPTGADRPYYAFGYALHDGDVDKPCEVVWAYRGKVTSISKTVNTIDDGTGSEGQDIEIEFIAPEAAWTATGKRDLDLALPITDNVADVAKWFAKVITPDNIKTELAAS